MKFPIGGDINVPFACPFGWTKFENPTNIECNFEDCRVVVCKKSG